MTIIKQITEEIKELGKDTVKEVAKQTTESGKDFFKAFVGLKDAKPVSTDEYKDKSTKQTEDDQKKLAEIRKRLREQMHPQQQNQPSAFEQAQQQEQYQKQRQVELAKQKQQSQLPTISAKPQRGSLLAHKKRKQNQVELGKLPGQ